MLLPGREYLPICKSHTDSTTLHHDNQGVLKLVKNAIFLYHTRNLEVQFNFTKELVDNKKNALKHCSSQEQIADTLTKLLGQYKFEYLRDQKLSVISNMTNTEK